MISLVVPLYNRAHTIVETLESVINQTSEDWELILVDDGSTDGTLEVIKEYLLKDKRIKLFNRNREPKGAPTCRNIGVDHSQGEWIIFLDSDDLLAKHCIQQRAASINKTEFNFAVFKTVKFVHDISNICGVFNTYPRPGEDYLGMFLEYNLPWQTMSAIWRKDFIKNIGGYSENLARFQDVDFHIKALRSSYNFKVFDHLPPDNYYRIGTEGGFRGDKFIKNQTTAARFFVQNILSEEVPPLEKKYKKHLKIGVYRLVQRYFNNSRPHLWKKNYEIIIKLSHKKGILSISDFILLKSFQLAWSRKSSLIKHLRVVGALNRLITYKIERI